MSPFFGSKTDKAAEKDAAAAELTRLQALPFPDLAVELPPGLGTGGADRIRKSGVNLPALMIWRMSAFPRATGFIKSLASPVRQAVLLLEAAGLVEKSAKQGGGGLCKATELGERAITAGDAARYLAHQ